MEDDKDELVVETNKFYGSAPTNKCDIELVEAAVTGWMVCIFIICAAVLIVAFLA